MKKEHPFAKNSPPLSKVVQRLKRDSSGAVTMIFAFAIIPLLLVMGIAIDFSRATSAKSRLQESADAAVLAAGSQPSVTQAQRLLLAANRVASNFGTSVSPAVQGSSLCGGSLSSCLKLLPTKTLSNITVSESESPGTWTVSVNAQLQTAVMQLAKISTLNLNATSQAQAIGVSASHPLEIALALDNTGSMEPNIQALRTAAQTLADTVMNAGGSSGVVRVSVVPYVAAVNPGLTDMTMVDTTAQSPWNGYWFDWVWIAYNSGCNQNWGPPSGGGGGSSGPGGSQSGDSGDARDILDILNPIRHMAQELLGVSTAHATSLGVTPNTIPPISTTDVKSQALYTGTGKNKKLNQYYVPNGFNYSLYTPSQGTYDNGQCDWLSNPGTVSHYDLFPRILNSSGSAVAWKGCVEARSGKTELSWLNNNWGGNYTTSTDYDVTDAPPSASDPLSLFVPYFWPDEPDYNMTSWGYQAPGAYVSGSGGFHNNFLADATYANGSTTAALPSSWGWTLNGSWGAGQFILKYDGTTHAAAISESGTTTAGPNASCPDPVLRLTSNQQTVDSKIQNLTYWYNGGTIISEGFMWAWRTLSPHAPYSDGAAYNSTVNKVIVLMTDGVNGLADNGNSNSSGSSSANISDYSAYGYLGAFRLGTVDGISQYGPVASPTSPPNDLTSFFDNRLLKACANAKAQGVTVYTVLFSANITAAQAAHSQSILSQCASTPAGAIEAADASSLNSAFGNIATAATAMPLHLTR
jgi:Flp pilus assembly protein TadG